MPFVLIAGGEDAEAGAVSFRLRDGSQVNGVARDETVRIIAAWNDEHRNDDPTAETLRGVIDD